MELRHLRYFVATAEELHFTRAAVRLHIGQPPLSQQIRDLERELGVQLFLRTGRHIELTEAGRVFLADARAILEFAEQARQSAQQCERGERGALRVGFTSSAALNQFVPGVISRYKESHPVVELTLSQNPTSVLFEQLRGAQIDIAFLRPANGEAQGLRVKFLIDEEMLVALPVRHRLTRLPRLTLQALQGERFLMYPRANGTAIYDETMDSCRRAGFNPRVVQEAPQLVSTVSFVAAGVGVAIVPKSMSQLHADGVVFRPIGGAAPRARMSIASRSGPVSAIVEDFWSFVERAAVESNGAIKVPERGQVSTP